MGTCRNPFEPNSAIEWAIYGAYIGIGFLTFLVGQWLNGQERSNTEHALCCGSS